MDDYAFSFDPESMVTEYSTKNRRQRAIYQKRDTIFSVSERLNLTEFAAFEDWINTTLNGGVDSFSGNYWDGDLERTATMTIVNGQYSFVYESQSSILVSYEIEVKDRDITDGENVYGMYQGGAPITYDYFNAFEQTINFNNFAP